MTGAAQAPAMNFKQRLVARLRHELSTRLSRHPHFVMSWHFTDGYRQYQNANAELAIWHFREGLKIAAEHWPAWHNLALVYLQLLGDLQEALRLFRYARRLRAKRGNKLGGEIPYRFLDPMWVMQIGHIANMEHLVKREILQGRDPRNIILYFPRSQIPANRTLLDKFTPYISIVRDEAKLPYPREKMSSVLEEYFLCQSLDGLTKHWWHASPEIFRAWESAGRAPLFSLSDSEMARGRASLKELGLPHDAWFACLHVRESGFKANHGYTTIENVLNADIDKYLPAIQAVVKRGGWVIRVGDPKMRPLPAMPCTIDYAHSSLKSEWLDVFLLGACRFFIGTSSGPAYVPPLFGRPCVLTNWAPTGQRPFNGRDLYIPKLYRAGSPPRQLSFAEIMAPPIGYAPHYVLAKTLGLQSVPNTSEEICQVVTEMLDRLDGSLSYTQEDEALQSAFDAVADTNVCIGNARAGRDFLRQHRALLGGAEARAR